jgi:hypothetical protein
VEFWLSGRLLLRGGAQRAPNKENGNNDFGIRLAASRPILLGLECWGRGIFNLDPVRTAAGAI